MTGDAAFVEEIASAFNALERSHWAVAAVLRTILLNGLQDPRALQALRGTSLLGNLREVWLGLVFNFPERSLELPIEPFEEIAQRYPPVSPDAIERLVEIALDDRMRPFVKHVLAGNRPAEFA